MARNEQLNFNRKAPDALLQTIEGDDIQLSSLWQEQPLLLAFTRHFGCTQCKEMLEEFVNGREEIKQAGLSLAVITQGTPKATATFAEEYAPNLFLLCDPERQAYEAYGLEKGSLFQTFLNPKVWSAVAKSQKKGYKVEAPPEGQDAMQMSGTFIISKEGRIELPYYYDHIADHPPLSLLLKGVLNTNWGQPFDGPITPNAHE